MTNDPNDDVVKSSTPSVTRAVSILGLLGKSPHPLGVNNIAGIVGIYPSTCLHILRALINSELVNLDKETKKYTLGGGVLTLAQSFLRRNPFIAHAQPYLDRIAKKHGVTSAAVATHGLAASAVVVAISRQPESFTVRLSVGDRFSPLTSAIGRCVAAYSGLPQKDLRKHFEAVKWQRKPEFLQWVREVESVRQLGYAVDPGNFTDGVTVISVPLLRSTGSVLHCLSAVGFSVQLRQSRSQAIVRDLIKAATDLQPMITA